MTDKEKNEPPSIPIVSGSFQVVSDLEKMHVEELQKSNKLDEESLYYARIFMED